MKGGEVFYWHEPKASDLCQAAYDICWTLPNCDNPGKSNNNDYGMCVRLPGHFIVALLVFTLYLYLYNIYITESRELQRVWLRVHRLNLLRTFYWKRKVWR